MKLKKGDPVIFVFDDLSYWIREAKTIPHCVIEQWGWDGKDHEDSPTKIRALTSIIIQELSQE